MQVLKHGTRRVSVRKSPSPTARRMRAAVLRSRRRCTPSTFPYGRPRALRTVTHFHGRPFAVPSSHDAATQPGRPPPSYASLRFPVLAYNGVLDVALCGQTVRIFILFLSLFFSHLSSRSASDCPIPILSPARIHLRAPLRIPATALPGTGAKIARRPQTLSTTTPWDRPQHRATPSSHPSDSCATHRSRRQHPRHRAPWLKRSPSDCPILLHAVRPRPSPPLHGHSRRQWDTLVFHLALKPTFTISCTQLRATPPSHPSKVFLAHYQRSLDPSNAFCHRRPPCAHIARCSALPLLRHTPQLDLCHPHRSIASRHTPHHRRRRSEALLCLPSCAISRLGDPLSRIPMLRTLDISPPFVHVQTTRANAHAATRFPFPFPAAPHLAPIRTLANDSSERARRATRFPLLFPAAPRPRPTSTHLE
ncbi:hypothetical protein B0H14DRAFT_990964 [Mycena olivaceomarginata]|nr:hypothetical protein B0H14DRAFT_990964 [Mycena olivaceomarginata]